MKVKDLITGLTILTMSFILVACSGPATPAGPGEPGSSEPIDEPSGPPPQPVFTGDADEIIFYNWSEYIDPFNLRLIPGGIWD